MISSSYKLQEEKGEADMIHHPTWSSLLGLLVFLLPQEDNQVCIT